MSNFRSNAIHPETGKCEAADYLDDHYGRHHYGVRFDDGKVFSVDIVLRCSEDHRLEKSLLPIEDDPAT